MAASVTSPKAGLRRRSGKTPLQEKVLNQTSPRKKRQQNSNKQKLANEQSKRKTQPEQRSSRRSGSSCDRVHEPDDQDEDAESASMRGTSAPSTLPSLPTPPSPSNTTPSKRKRKLALDDSDTALNAEVKEKKAYKSSLGKRQPAPSPTKYVANSSGKIIVGTKSEGKEDANDRANKKAERTRGGAKPKEEKSEVKINKGKTDDFVISVNITDLSASILPTKKQHTQRIEKQPHIQPSAPTYPSFSCRGESCSFSAATERVLIDHVTLQHVTKPFVVMCRNRVDYCDEKKKCRDCEQLLPPSSGSSSESDGEPFFNLNSPRKTKKSILIAMAFDLRGDFDSDDGDDDSPFGGFDVEACVAEVKLTEEEQRQVEEREEEARKERERKERERVEEEKEKAKEVKEKAKKDKEREKKEKERVRKEELDKKKALKEKEKTNFRADDSPKVKSSSASSRRSTGDDRDLEANLTLNNADQKRFQPFIKLETLDGQRKSEKPSKATVVVVVKDSAKNVASQHRRSSRRS